MTSSPTELSSIHRMMQNMLSIQTETNNQFVGPDWAEKAALREEIDYIPPILDEAVELLRSDMSWKFWKKGAPQADLSNMRLEFIDILHFSMSEAVARSLGSPEEVSEAMAASYCSVFGDESEELKFDSRKTRHSLMSFLSSLMFLYSMDGTDVFMPGGIPEGEDDSAEGNDIVSELDAVGFLESGDFPWDEFWGIGKALGISLSYVYMVFISKAALNRFRIANNDKEGKYHRNWWEGKEDNFYVMQYLDQLPEDAPIHEITVESLYTVIQSMYQSFLDSCIKG